LAAIRRDDAVRRATGVLSDPGGGGSVGRRAFLAAGHRLAD
jgi:hypothetical protein